MDVFAPVLMYPLYVAVYFAFRPVVRALRSSHGGIVLSLICAVSVVWLIVGCRIGESGGGEGTATFGTLTILGAPALALVSMFVWVDPIAGREVLPSVRPGGTSAPREERAIRHATEVSKARWKLRRVPAWRGRSPQ